MKKKNFLFDPKEHGGEKDMLLYFMAVGTAAGALIIWIIKEIFFYAE